MPELYLNKVYKEKVTQKLNLFVSECVDQIHELEEEVYKNTVKIELEKDEIISTSRINTIFKSLFNATDIKTFDLVVDKILNLINRFKTRVAIDDFFEETSNVDYQPIEVEVLRYAKQEINRVMGYTNLPFEYVFPYEGLERVSITKDKKDNEMIPVINVERFPDLVSKVEELLPTLKVAADKFGLVEVQDVNFTTGIYTALKDCFFDNKYKKSIKPDLDDLLKKINEMEEQHCLEDVFTDDFLYHVLVVLEASYFVCTFYSNNILGDNATSNKNARYKNEQELLGNIYDNLAYYLDNLAYHTDYDFVTAYPFIVRELDKDIISPLFNSILRMNTERKGKK